MVLRGEAMTRRISLKRLRRMYARRRLGGAVQELHPEGPSIRKIPSLGVHDHEDRRVHGFYSGGWRWRERERGKWAMLVGTKRGRGHFHMTLLTRIYAGVHAWYGM
jgi:hypothetical protein